MTKDTKRSERRSKSTVRTSIRDVSERNHDIFSTGTFLSYNKSKDSTKHDHSNK